MYGIRVRAVSGPFSRTRSGFLSTRYLPMDQARWLCAAEDLDGFQFVPFTLPGNDAPKTSKFLVENIGNEGQSVVEESFANAEHQAAAVR